MTTADAYTYTDNITWTIHNSGYTGPSRPSARAYMTRADSPYGSVRAGRQRPYRAKFVRIGAVKSTIDVPRRIPTYCKGRSGDRRGC